MTPCVSVIVPTYNRSYQLTQTIDAMLGQTFSDWELIIYDDASSDNTQEVVRQYSDSRIRYYRNDRNIGIYPNWNRGIKLAQGRYIAIYHDHDIYLPTIIQRSVETLEKYPSVYFVHTAHLLIDEANQPVDIDLRPFPTVMSGQEMQKLIAQSWHSPILAPTVMVRREGYELAGLYDDSIYGLGADMDMWFRLSAIGDVAYIADPQMFWRVRTKTQYTGKFRWKNVSGSIQMRQNHMQMLQEDNSIKTVFWRMKFMTQRDYRLLMYISRAFVLKDVNGINGGMEVIDQYGSIFVRTASRIIGNSIFLKRLMRRSILPRHYDKVRNMQIQRKERVQQFLNQTNDKLLLETLANLESTTDA